ncbi:recombinase family protein [Clostridium felsineum]|uniref:recombinase family protein n=1 Tax=Clostridium felsineum TaxID=36839 RepID=UPI00098CEAC2|nr:recombinase family protein [Clostridium felsineum]URZ16847.1 hypothetical protein CLFE_028940 [Clostridium felsineum DSM 794]
MENRLNKEIADAPKVALYTRVSTDEQETSIHNQHDSYTRLIEEKGWEIYKVYTDEGISGTKSVKRLAFQQLLEDGKNGKYNILLAKSLSRFARNQREALQAIADLRAVGIRVIFREDGLDSAVDTMRFGLFAWLAEQESQTTSKRIKETWRGMEKRGQMYIPNMPYGYQYVKGKKGIKIVAEQAKVVNRVFELYLSGMGFRNISNLLKEEGVLTQGGTNGWHASMIGRMLQNRAYIGYLVQHQTETIDVTMNKRRKIPRSDWAVHKGVFPPIIRDSVFQRVQEEVAKRQTAIKANGRPTRHSSKSLFSNLVVCADCGASFTVKRKKSKREYEPYYICLNYEQFGKAKCGHGRVAVYEGDLVQILRQEIGVLIETNFKAIMDAIKARSIDSHAMTPKEELKAIQAKIDSLLRLSNTLLTSYSEGIVGATQYKLQNEQIEGQLQALLKHKEQLDMAVVTNRSQENKEQLLIRSIKELARFNREEWTNQMLKEVVERIEISDDRTIKVYLRYQKPQKPQNTQYLNTQYHNVTESS